MAFANFTSQFQVILSSFFWDTGIIIRQNVHHKAMNFSLNKKYHHLCSTLFKFTSYSHNCANWHLAFVASVIEKIPKTSILLRVHILRASTCARPYAARRIGPHPSPRAYSLHQLGPWYISMIACADHSHVHWEIVSQNKFIIYILYHQ